MLERLLGALLIFCLRIGDVSIGTLRTTYLVRGEWKKAVPLAFVESFVWVVAISRIIAQVKEPLNMLAYAGGFAAGTAVGMAVERWIASGSILVRIISRGTKDALAESIRAAGFGVTVLPGEGRGGEQAVLFVVTRRKRGPELVELIRSIDAQAFITVDSIQQAIGGYLPKAPSFFAKWPLLGQRVL